MNKLEMKILMKYFTPEQIENYKEFVRYCIGDKDSSLDKKYNCDLLAHENDGFIDWNRSLAEIETVRYSLSDQLWFHRYLQGRMAVSEQIEMGMDKDITDSPGTKPAKEIIAKYGIENLGPLTDFELGMLSGRLASLRWVCGEEWENLDT